MSSALEFVDPNCYVAPLRCATDVAQLNNLDLAIADTLHHQIQQKQLLKQSTKDFGGLSTARSVIQTGTTIVEDPAVA